MHSFTGRLDFLIKRCPVLSRPFVCALLCPALVFFSHLAFAGPLFMRLMVIRSVTSARDKSRVRFSFHVGAAD